MTKGRPYLLLEKLVLLVPYRAQVSLSFSYTFNNRNFILSESEKQNSPVL